MNICQLFLAAARRNPERIALIQGKRSVTYAELDAGVRNTAAYFRQKGIGKGDRVLVFVPMSIDLYRVVLALFYVGATAVFLDEWVSKKRLELCCRLADCKGFIGTPKARILAWISSELRRIPIKPLLHGAGKEETNVVDVSSEDSALITFTTGSTGIPKAALRTHGFLREQFDALIDEIKPQVDDVDMPLLPIVLFVNLGVGCTSVIADFKSSKPESMKPAVIVDQLRKHQVNRVTASPFFVRKLAEYLLVYYLQLPKIEKVFTGGAPVFPMEAALYHKAFPDARSLIVYGSTEAEPISSVEASKLANSTNEQDAGLYVGRPYHKAEVRIIRIKDAPILPTDEQGLEDIILDDGEIGEIIVAGPHVLKQYFNNDEAFARNKIRAGETTWHRTGDSGYSKNGELYLCGRCERLIYRNGRIISPFLVEGQLQAMNGVTLGTVIEHGEQLILVVESKLKKEEVLPLVKNLEFDVLKVVKRIPRDPRHHSKVDYGKLEKNLLSSR